MNIAQIFEDKPLFELALAISGLPADSPQRETLAIEAGLGTDTINAFLDSVRVFDAIRANTGCAGCDNCVDDNTLAEFVDGALEAEELAQVEQRLAACGQCLRNAVSLAQLAHEVIPATPWKTVILGIARRGVQILSAPLEGIAELTLQPVPVMSAVASSTARRWQIEDGGITATFTVTLEEGGYVGLSAGFEHQGTALQGGQVLLRADGQLVEFHPIGSGWEHHTFWHLEAGNYTVEVNHPQLLPACFPISVKSLEDS